jgi:hypothetical protein
MEFTFKLNEEQLNVIIKHLDMGAHKEVRGVLDYLIGNANEQAAKARESMMPAPTPDGAPSSTNP